MDSESTEDTTDLVEENYYAFLNVPKTATQEEIVTAYRRLSRIYHPDKHANEENKQDAELLFNRTKKAYEVLSDPHRRAIYDSLGERGLQTEGWELVQRTRTPQEIREEYERIARENEERRLQQRTNPKGQLTVNVNCTDWFNSYDVDDPDYGDSFHLPEVSGVSISQSVEAPLTLRDVTTLSGQANATNGTGSGGVAVSWRRLLGSKGWIESEFAAGNGPSLSLRAFCTITKHVFSNVAVIMQATPKGIAPGLNAVLAMQMSEHTLGSLVWRAGLASSMSVSLTRDTTTMHFVAMIQAGIPHSFAFIAYTRKMKSGKLKLGLRGGTFGVQIEYGAEHKVSKHTSLSATMSVGVPLGVSLKVRVIRANYTFSFPIHLSEEVIPAAVFYGTVTPIVTWLVVKSMIIDPYVARQKAKEKERHRQANRSRMAEKRREAEASVSLMRATFDRIRRDEESRQGLVILEALYYPVSTGPAANEASGSGDSSPMSPPYNPLNRPADAMEVTIQLQCLVQDSKLILHDASKSQLPGFYDPGIGDDKQLYVKYLFRGQVHEVTVSDLEALRIPRTTFYIGLTKFVRGRITGYRFDVRHNNTIERPVAEHAASHSLVDLSKCFNIKILKSLPGDYNYSDLRSWELAHILVLHSHKADNDPGLNIR